MRNVFLLLLSVLTIAGCKKEAEKTVEASAKKDSAVGAKPKGKEFKMYELTEMAALMERMYAENSQLKQRIVNGDTLGKFPKDYLKIHSAAMTDEGDNDAFFKENAANFIKAQQGIYTDPTAAKANFNTMVDACIKCHESKCGGPIQRIQKLYIK